jgi:hypothetical protein
LSYRLLSRHITATAIALHIDQVCLVAIRSSQSTAGNAHLAISAKTFDQQKTMAKYVCRHPERIVKARSCARPNRLKSKMNCIDCCSSPALLHATWQMPKQSIKCHASTTMRFVVGGTTFTIGSQDMHAAGIVDEISKLRQRDGMAMGFECAMHQLVARWCDICQIRHLYR